MRVINVEEISKNIKEMCIEANYYLSDDMKNALYKAAEQEENPLGCQILNQLKENLDIAGVEQIPICQDTGMAVVFAEVGQDVHIEGGSLTDAINKGVHDGYVEGYLRKSVVNDPFIRENTKDNTPAVIHYSIVPGENIKLTVAPKGFGSENMSRVFMLKPADGIEGVKNAIITAVKDAGPNACPPMVVGVGIGGTFEKCALLAKQALTRPVNEHSDIPYVKEMEEELGAGNKKPEILSKLAQYELTLKDWIRDHKGYRKYVTIAGKCWPAFQTQFGFVPCYVNSRLAAQGIPVSCEVDIYGALSEFIGTVVSQDAVTLLDINNSVPADMYNEEIKDNYDYTQKDTFMGFHCGNTAKSKLSFCEMKYQKIMARTLPEEVTQGTLEGDIAPGDITFFRLQSTADTKLRAYVAQGEILPVATRSFGSIGVFAIPEMGRFYRHVLIEKNFPHHGAVAFGHFGKTLYEVFKYIGVDVDEIGFNQPKNMLYKTENPFS